MKKLFQVAIPVISFVFLAQLAMSDATLPNPTEQQRALLAYLKVQPGAEQQFLDAAKDVIAESRKEPGNLIYNLHESVEDPQ